MSNLRSVFENSKKNREITKYESVQMTLGHFKLAIATVASIVVLFCILQLSLSNTKTVSDINSIANEMVYGFVLITLWL